MGKKIIGAIAFAAIAVAAGWNYKHNSQNVEFSNLTLENIEALAHPAEEGIDFGCKSSTIWCYYSNGWKYGEYYKK